MLNNAIQLLKTTIVAAVLGGLSFQVNAETPKTKITTTTTTTTTTPTTTSTQENKDLDKAEMTKLSEAFGHFIGRNLTTPGINFDLDALIKGIRDGAQGKPAPMTDQEYEQKMAVLQSQAYRKMSEENLKAAETFLNDNAKNAQVIQLIPGKLQYEELESGHGEIVKESGTPQIQYVGKFLDGKVFSSSKESGGAITIPLDHTIPGFSKGLVGMKEGGKRRLFIHPDLGYGTSGHLPPNSLLVFDVEIVKAQAETDEPQVEVKTTETKQIETHETSSPSEDVDSSKEEHKTSENEKKSSSWWPW